VLIALRYESNRSCAQGTVEIKSSPSQLLDLIVKCRRRSSIRSMQDQKSLKDGSSCYRLSFQKKQRSPWDLDFRSRLYRQLEADTMFVPSVGNGPVAPGGLRTGPALVNCSSLNNWLQQLINRSAFPHWFDSLIKRYLLQVRHAWRPRPSAETTEPAGTTRRETTNVFVLLNLPVSLTCQCCQRFIRSFKKPRLSPDLIHFIATHCTGTFFDRLCLLILV